MPEAEVSHSGFHTPATVARGWQSAQARAAEAETGAKQRGEIGLAGGQCAQSP
jgi:hypothetical protein